MAIHIYKVFKSVNHFPNKITIKAVYAERRACLSADSPRVGVDRYAHGELQGAQRSAAWTNCDHYHPWLAGQLSVTKAQNMDILYSFSFSLYMF